MMPICNLLGEYGEKKVKRSLNANNSEKSARRGAHVKKAGARRAVESLSAELGAFKNLL